MPLDLACGECTVISLYVLCLSMDLNRVLRVLDSKHLGFRWWHQPVDPRRFVFLNCILNVYCWNKARKTHC